MMTVLVCSLSVGISLALCNETLSKENEKARDKWKHFKSKQTKERSKNSLTLEKSRGMCISLAILLRTPVCLLKQKSN